MKKLLSILLAFSSAVATTIWTAHFDNSRLNWNNSEYLLKTSNVSGLKFHRIGAWSGDGAFYSQPLYVPNLTISGVQHDVMFVASMHDTVYAFDADKPGSSPLWSRSVGTSRTSYPGIGPGPGDTFYGQEVGCMSSPVIDLGNSVLYAACMTATPNTVLAKINLLTGALISSVNISGSFGGATFDPSQEQARPALTLANGLVYVAFASWNDISPWGGWVMAYDSSLTQQHVFCVTPSGNGGGIWQSGGALAVDSSGNLYAQTGNGTYDGTSNFGMSILKLSPSLSLLDWWTPSNYAALNAADEDLSSSRAMLIPGTTLVVGAGKDYRIYSVDSTCMGHLQAGGSPCSNNAQVFFTNSSGPQPDQGIYGALFFDGAGYWPNGGKGTNTGKIYRFTISGSTWNTTPNTTASGYKTPGAIMTASSAGNGVEGIVWATTVNTDSENSPQPGTLRAYDGWTLTELWNSGNVTTDSMGTFAKFASPTVADGKVFVSNLDSQVVLFGLAATSQMRGQVVMRGQATIR